jgi:DNA-directed RNA polymerase alpha subunit
MGSSEVSDNVPVEQLSLTARAYSMLKRNGINTVAQLAIMPEQDLMNLSNFTPAMMEELRAKVKKKLGSSPWGD